MTVVLKPSWDSNNQQQNADEYWLDNETLVLHHPSVETALVVMGESESLYIDPTAPGASTLILAAIAMGTPVTLPENGSQGVLGMLRDTAAGNAPYTIMLLYCLNKNINDLAIDLVEPPNTDLCHHNPFPFTPFSSSSCYRCY